MSVRIQIYIAALDIVLPVEVTSQLYYRCDVTSTGKERPCFEMVFRIEPIQPWNFKHPFSKKYSDWFEEQKGETSLSILSSSSVFEGHNHQIDQWSSWACFEVNK